MSTAEDRAFQYGRYAVGIDLGTTNCALSYWDFEAGWDLPRLLPVPQLLAPGEYSPEPMLPSFCYLPAGNEFGDAALELPWGCAENVVGYFAREHGALVPERLVMSAKSWLSHSGVNRRGKILPWGSELGTAMMSPLQVSAAYLTHLRNAWNHRFGQDRDQDGTPCLLEEQSLVITVPASFDETARALTLEAAHLAGLKHVTLLEEPLAAFYSWLYRRMSDWRQSLGEKALILVLDVGGGTTDLSMIELEQGGTLRRTAVGEHLLLGGDNMDMALAHLAETSWNGSLGQRQWSQLCQECRRAKEKLLGEAAPDSAQVCISNPGSSLFAGMRKYEFDRDNVRKFILDGFFPLLPLDAPMPERKAGVRKMGLPYASDPAITRYLLQFLKRGDDVLQPNYVLFNGGTMLPGLLRERVLDAIGEWCGHRPVELAAHDLSLAVAEGASCYGVARAGRELRVKGGIARAYYLAVEGLDGKLVCVMPRDTEEGVTQRLENMRFQLRMNRPVRFELYSSAVRLGDRLGDFVPNGDEFTKLPPLSTSLKSGRNAAAAEVSATVSACLGETGVLELWCNVLDSGRSFPLAFDLRGETEQPSEVDVTIDDGAQQAMCAVLEECFGGSGKVANVMRDLEAAAGIAREDWGSVLLRRLGDLLLKNVAWRRRSAEHEARWLNLLGYFLRPGLGVAGDDWRVGECWKLWFAGPVNANKIEVLAQWYVLWRRISPGLKIGQQEQLAGELCKRLVERGGELKVRFNGQDEIEMWRAVASVERAGAARRQKLLQALLEHSGRMNDSMFWVAGRLAERKALFAGADAIVPASRMHALLKLLLDKARQAGYPRSALFALALASRLTGERTLDLDSPDRDAVANLLEKHDAPEKWRKMPLEIIEEDDGMKKELLGDALPLGLFLR